MKMEVRAENSTDLVIEVHDDGVGSTASESTRPATASPTYARARI